VVKYKAILPSLILTNRQKHLADWPPADFHLFLSHPFIFKS
jgi:hypothetical protein